MRWIGGVLPTLVAAVTAPGLVAASAAPVLAAAATAQESSGRGGAARGADSLPRLAGEIQVDADLSDPAWQAVPPVELTVHTPQFGSEPTEETVIRVAYDDEAIYVGAWMYDSEPEAIKVHSVIRDVDNGGDFLNVLIDAFNDNQNAVVFTTTPAGNRLDFQVQNDAEGPNPASLSWNAFWDVAVSRTDRGWFAEMRVPISSLRFQADVDGRVVMGLSVNRLIGRKNERHIFPAIEPNWSLAPFKPSQARDVLLEGVQSRRPVYVTPYAATRHRTNAELVPQPARYERRGELEVDVGGDLKYAVSNQLNLDLTINTDFAEVEVDDERVNLTRFSLFFPERRQFFLEREGVFDFGVAGSDRPFHSRRIGLTPEGAPVPIIGGGRLTGRASSLDVGLIDMQTSRGAGQPAENDGVIRVRRNFGDRDSYVGFLGTSRVGGGEHNVLLGSDLEWNFADDAFLTAEFTQTLDSRPDSARGLLPKGRARIQLERRRLEGTGFGLVAGATGSAYRPALGFVQRTGVWDGAGYLRHGIPTRTGGLRQVAPWITSSIVGTNGRRNVETWDIATGIELEANSGALLTADVTHANEDLAEEFVLGEEVRVPAGPHRFTQASLELAPAQGWRAGAGFRGVLGGFFDGRIAALEVSPFWSVSPYFRLTAFYRLDRIVFDERSQELTAHILRLRPEVAFDARLSTSATIQYNSTADLATLNFRLRYNFSEGTDLWIVYGHVANTDTRASVPELPRTQATVLTVKYTYTFLR